MNSFKENWKWLETRLLIFWLLGSLIVWVVNAAEVGFDSTDGEERSGMALHVDAKTGCHYLASKHGGITPRLSKEGIHFCNGE